MIGSAGPNILHGNNVNGGKTAYQIQLTFKLEFIIYMHNIQCEKTNVAKGIDVKDVY